MSNALPHAKPSADGATDRLLDQVAMWGRFCASARELKADAAFVLGDLFDKPNVDPITLANTLGAFREAPCPFYIIPGNHDGIDPVRGERYLPEAFRQMGLSNVIYIDHTSGPLQAKHLRFWPIEYTDLERTRVLLAEANGGIMAKPPKRREILLMHQSIVGCTHFGWKCDAGIDAEELEGWDEVYSGHFHETQSIGENGMYLGAPMHHRFDDAGRQAGWWHVVWEKGKKTRRTLIDAGAPRFHTAEWPCSKPSVRPGDYLRINVTATHAELTTLKSDVDQFVAKLTKKGVNASWKHKPVYHHEVRIAKEETGTGATPEEVVNDYVESLDVSTEGLDRERLKQLGLDALAHARRSHG